MLLDSLIVIHLKGSQEERKSAIERALQSEDVLRIDTCLRTMWLVNKLDSLSLQRMKRDASDVLVGEEAYFFLLRVSCGLESAVPGETEIFSQVKGCWHSFEKLRTELVGCLRPWMQKLIADTKEIRAGFLQGIGGASYGSLARKLIDPHAGDSILILGAGKLGQAVSPLFRKNNLRIWNRSKERLNGLVQKLGKGVFPVPDEELMECIRTSDHLIICTDLDPALESPWIEARLSCDDARGKVVHLGGKRPQVRHWEPVPHLYSLTEIFQLQGDQDDYKKQCILQARAACHEKAKHRYLMDAITINHSWEDLMAF